MAQRGERHPPAVVCPVEDVCAEDVVTEGKDLPPHEAEDVIAGAVALALRGDVGMCVERVAGL